jgi:hypothetical protein
VARRLRQRSIAANISALQIRIPSKSCSRVVALAFNLFRLPAEDNALVSYLGGVTGRVSDAAARFRSGGTQPPARCCSCRAGGARFVLPLCRIGGVNTDLGGRTRAGTQLRHLPFTSREQARGTQAEKLGLTEGQIDPEDRGDRHRARHHCSESSDAPNGDF